MAIGRELDERGITTPAAIGEALGMPAAEATKLLTRPSVARGRCGAAPGCGGAAGGAGAGPMTEAGQDLETRIRERAYAL